MPTTSPVESTGRRARRGGPLRTAICLATHVVAAMLAVAQTAAAQGARPDSRPTVAAMPYFNNGSVGPNRGDYDALGKGIADVLITELAGNPGIRVIERDRVLQLMDEQNLGTAGRVDQETAVKVGKLLGVHHMIFGGFIVDPRGTMRLDARAVHVETGVVEHVESVTDKADNLLSILSTISGKLNTGMKLPPIPSGTAKPALNPEATKPGRWRDLILYARAEDANDKKDRTRALALYKEFLQKSPPTVLATQRQRAELKVRELSAGS